MRAGSVGAVQSSPTAPPTTSRDPQEIALLLQYVRERDVRCPRCDYNLRNLSQPVCPECREDLRLTVGLERLRIAGLIAALAPGIFSGMAAFFLTGMLVLVTLRSPGSAPWPPYALALFGWASAAFAIGLFLRRHAFLKTRSQTQATIAAAIWFAHIGFFVLMWALLS